MIKKIFISLLFLGTSTILLAKSWPTNSIAQLKQNQGIQIDCGFLSAMLGRDMYNDYPVLLLQSYKNSYPDYSDFEAYTIKYRGTADPIRVNTLKSLVKNCNFSSVWNIMEKNSPAVVEMKRSDAGKYNRLRSITISKLQSTFGSVEKFVEQMAIYPQSSSNKLENIANESAKELMSNSYSNSKASPRNISLPSNCIDAPEHRWQAISVEFSENSTIVNKRVTPKCTRTWITSDTHEYIEDAETGTKYYIISSSIGFNREKILNDASPYTFKEVYPALPSNVRYINISSGYQYYVKNVRVR